MADSDTRLSRLRLGDILLGAKLVTKEQLAEGLDAQQSSGGRLGERLVELGYLSDADLKRCLARQVGLPFDGRTEIDVDLQTARLVPEEVATRHRALPVRDEGTTLTVALSDPLNFRALDEIGLQTGRMVRAVIVTEGAMQRALLKVYGVPDLDGQENGSRIYDLEVPGEQSTVVRLVNSITAQAIDNRASDIHIEPLADRVRVRYRVDGTLVESNPLPLSLHANLMSRLKVMGGMDIAERRIPQDGQIQIRYRERRLDLRVNTVPTIFGERIAIRLLDRSAGLKTIEGLRMPHCEEERYREMISRPNGIILITGPTGSGKSTTLMATLTVLNKPDVHIITIEDPVEYQVPGISQIQVNPKAGLTFASGLRAFLRQDPDVIMVGEIRDSETADIAIRAALTGHLVFSTLHTNQAVGAIGRLADMGVQPFLLGSSLLGVVAQRLVRVLCDRCKEPYELPGDDPVRLLPGVGDGPLEVFRPKGCGFCDFTGYRGRRAVFEVLTVNPAMRELISQNRPAAEILENVIHSGMRTLWENGMDLVRQGLTTIDEVRRVAYAEEG